MRTKRSKAGVKHKANRDAARARRRWPWVIMGGMGQQVLSKVADHIVTPVWDKGAIIVHAVWAKRAVVVTAVLAGLFSTVRVETRISCAGFRIVPLVRVFPPQTIPVRS